MSLPDKSLTRLETFVTALGPSIARETPEQTVSIIVICPDGFHPGKAFNSAIISNRTNMQAMALLRVTTAVSDRSCIDECIAKVKAVPIMPDDAYGHDVIRRVVFELDRLRAKTTP